MCIQIKEKDLKKIENIAARIHVKAELVNRENWDRKIGVLAGTVPEFTETKSTERSLPKESLLIMCGLTEKHVDKILAGLKAEQIAIDYKAVMTDHNQRWTLQEMYREMFREKMAFAGVEGMNR